jgi:topoisomerase-4 subunit A
MQANFLAYASYVILDRAIPDIRDGLKPVQRRLLHTLFEMEDGRFHKVANVMGESMKLHPHGDAAIRDALVVLANKEYFIERQGNFGNIFTGHPAAAARYIECRLTPLALATLFHRPTTAFVPSYDGRKKEPQFLPAKLPVLLLLGTEGIAVGMATRILPHNFNELLQAQIDLLKGKEPRVFPDFPQGGIMDASDYADGRGKVTVRARLKPVGEKKIIIHELPFSTTTEHLIQSIESAAQRGQIKIAALHDYTTDRVEIEISLPRGAKAKELIPQLYAYTDCEVSVSSNIVAIREGQPVDLTVTQVLASLTDQLLTQLRTELEYELGQLQDRQHWLTLEQIFIENKVYSDIETAKTAQAVQRAVWDGMHQYDKQFVRPMVKDDVETLLQIRIRRISAYDRKKNRADLESVRAAIVETEAKLAKLEDTAIQYLKGILKKFGTAYPRRTRIESLRSVDRKAIARANIKLSYDPATGFFGSKVKGSKYVLEVSEFDRVLIVCRDGSYRVVGPVEKLLLGAKVLHCERFHPEQGAQFTLVYRDDKNIAYGKKVAIKAFIRDREYNLIKDRKGRLDLLLPAQKAGKVELQFAASPRQRVAQATFALSKLTFKGITAKGQRLASKPVARIRRLP